MANDIPVERQFNGTMRLIEVQLRRAAETYNLEDNIRICQEKGMINGDDAAFIHAAFELKRRFDAGEPLDEDEAHATIKRLHKLVAMNLNMGDCA